MTEQPSLITEKPKQRNIPMLILQCIGIFVGMFRLDKGKTRD